MGKDKNQNVFPSFQAAEAYCHINRGTLHRYHKQGRLQRHEDGFRKADLDQLISEREGRKSASRKTKDLFRDIQKAQLRYRKAKAKREELNVKQLQGSLMSREDVETAFESRAYELARSLLLVSRRIGYQVAIEGSQEYKSVVAIIDKEIRRMMEAYSRRLDI